MKRILLSTILLMTFMSSWAQFSGSGSGTEEDPYRITNALQLTQMANFLGNSSVYFQLQNDIDLSEWIAENNPSNGWSPIGNESMPFKGHFDGQNHVVSGFYMNNTQDYTGFWGYISEAEIKRLTIKGSDVVGGKIVGVFVGWNFRSSLTECHAVLSGTISSIYSSSSYGSSNSVGGICGHQREGYCDFCSFRGNIVSQVISGGIVGCLDENKLYISEGRYYYGDRTGISNCCFIGNVESTFSSGGIVGGFINSSVKVGSYNYYYFYSYISNNMVIGSVKGESSAGGVVAFVDYYEGGSLEKTLLDDIINNNIVNANVSSGCGIGGSIAEVKVVKNVVVNSIIENGLYRIANPYNSYHSPDIAENGTSSSNRVSVTTRTFVNDEEVFLEDSRENGMTVGLAALRNKDNYIGWGYDFDTDWAIIDGKSFPYKPYMAAPPIMDETPAANATTITGTCETGGKVYLYYNNAETPISTTCVGNRFTFNISPLIEGSTVKLYADNDITTSYTMESTVGSGSSSSTIAVASVTLNKSAITLAPNYSFQLSATVLPLTAGNRSVSWVTSNNSVATVSDSGLLTAKAEGTATISCTANDGSGQRATCAVTVSNDAAASSGLKGDMNDDGVVDTQDALLIIKQYVGKE